MIDRNTTRTVWKSVDDGKSAVRFRCFFADGTEVTLRKNRIRKRVATYSWRLHIGKFSFTLGDYPNGAAVKRYVAEVFKRRNITVQR